MKARRCWPVVAAAAVLAVTGCVNPLSEDFGWTEESVLKRGWIPPRHVHAARLYCYRTLAEYECFDKPEEGQESRLIGYYGPPPVKPAQP